MIFIILYHSLVSFYSQNVTCLAEPNWKHSVTEGNYTANSKKIVLWSHSQLQDLVENAMTRYAMS